MDSQTPKNQTCLEISRLPMFSEFSTWDEREETFAKYWPKMLPINHKRLITNGLFYTRQSDKVICFYCGGGFKNLTETDDILYIHVKAYSGCPLPMMCHSTKTINEVVNYRPRPNIFDKIFDVNDADLLLLRLAAPNLEMNDLRNRIESLKRIHKRELYNTVANSACHIRELTLKIQELKEAIKRLRNLVECPVCMECTKNTVLLCGHGFCISCLDRIDGAKRECPQCRQSFYFARKLYL